MSASQHTEHYNLPLFVDNDKPTWRGDWNQAMQAIDQAIDTTGDAGEEAAHFLEFMGVTSAETATAKGAKIDAAQTSTQVQGIIDQNTNGYQNASQVQAIIDTNTNGYQTASDVQTAIDAIEETPAQFDSFYSNTLHGGSSPTPNTLLDMAWMPLSVLTGYPNAYPGYLPAISVYDGSYSAYSDGMVDITNNFNIEGGLYYKLNTSATDDYNQVFPFMFIDVTIECKTATTLTYFGGNYICIGFESPINSIYVNTNSRIPAYCYNPGYYNNVDTASFHYTSGIPAQSMNVITSGGGSGTRNVNVWSNTLQIIPGPFYSASGRTMPVGFKAHACGLVIPDDYATYYLNTAS